MNRQPTSGGPRSDTACTVCWRNSDPAPGPRHSCVDVSDWPLIVLTAAGANTSEQIECRIRQLDAHFGRNEPFALVIDARNLARGQRDGRLTGWLDEKSDVLGRNCAGVALVVKGTLVRFIISSFLVMMKRPVEYKVFESADDARRWARGLLAQREIRDVHASARTAPGAGSSIHGTVTRNVPVASSRWRPSDSTGE
ncbi:MAG: STAS/SEC14 domain-containing protein [Deltaproteobacteria bacterium]